MITKKILLIDDSTTVLAMGRMILGGRYELSTARNGREGVDRALAMRPDLILLDIALPELDGLEALTELRKQAATRHTPVIMVTAYGDSWSRETSLKRCCNDYIIKPIHSLVLLAKVRSLLGE